MRHIAMLIAHRIGLVLLGVNLLFLVVVTRTEWLMPLVFATAFLVIGLLHAEGVLRRQSEEIRCERCLKVLGHRIEARCIECMEHDTRPPVAWRGRNGTR